MVREYNFLKDKYYKLILPNLFTEISDKLGTVLDVMVVGFLIGSSQLPALNVVSSFYLVSTIIYALYGQGGSLLSIKLNQIGIIKKLTNILLILFWEPY